MPPAATNELRVFVLNVGQADTSVIVTPQGRVVVIDAVNPTKLRNLLTNLGLLAGEDIEHLVITHPHSDHYRGAQSLINNYGVREVTLPPFWIGDIDFRSGYNALVDLIDTRHIAHRFVSGYERIYPDHGTYAAAADEPMIELLGPANSALAIVQTADEFNENHLSVMARLRWRSFAMVFAGDAQMENWAQFDREGMLAGDCAVLKAAHHGSKNGTQWERLDRLDPKTVIVSSDPGSGHELPDLLGSAAFYQYSRNRLVALTGGQNNAGTIKITSTGSQTPTITRFCEAQADDVQLGSEIALTRATNPTNWEALVQQRMA